MTNQTEEWRAVRGFVGYYEVSNLGYVRSCKSRKVLSRQLNGGYFSVQLFKSGSQSTHFIHILVCTAFNEPKPYEDAKCLHRDDNPVRNIPSNLYWGTQKDNAKDRERNRPIKKALGDQYAQRAF